MLCFINSGNVIERYFGTRFTDALCFGLAEAHCLRSTGLSGTHDEEVEEYEDDDNWSDGGDKGPAGASVIYFGEFDWNLVLVDFADERFCGFIVLFWNFGDVLFTVGEFACDFGFLPDSILNLFGGYAAHEFDRGELGNFATTVELALRCGNHQNDETYQYHRDDDD